ncbi:MAG: hypothetical protein HQK73_04560 [Desulfamplus sp.]|nr:hypothetical protein [Desulfamplus sp.]
MTLNGNEDTAVKKDDGEHKWRFVRVGGFDHVLITTGDDIQSIGELDQKLWAALGCPTEGLEFDSTTLAYMDKDGDSRIRAPEIIEAINWTLSLIKNPSALSRVNELLPLSAINDETPEGKNILACAKEILANRGKAGAESISLEDTADTVEIFANTKFNGDGIIPAMASDDESVKKLIEEIMECMGSEQDRSGLPGITKEKADLFFNEARDYSDWQRQAEVENAGFFPLGEMTSAAATSFEAVELKADDYFTRCSLAAFDPNAASLLNPAQVRYEDISLKNISAETEEIAAFPLAKIEPQADLPLIGSVNPAWAKALLAFRDTVVRPLFGETKESLSEKEWTQIKEKFAEYQAWKISKKESPVEKLGLQRLREILDSKSQEKIAELIEKDKSLESSVNSITSLDKLIHYYRDLYTLLNNFVSFYDFYTPGKNGIFQAGTLYLDGRSCELCIKVKDVAAHSTLAQMGGVYLAYCECTRKECPEKMNIAAAFTDGDADNLMVGRNGIFYDSKNRDWNATIVKIIEHPISIRQAFWSPYKRFARMLREQIEKFASERDKSVNTSSASLIADTTKKVEGKPTAVPFDVGKFAGIFAAIGLAVGAIGTAAAAVVTGFMGLKWWQMPLTIIGLILFISGPSMIIAALKLRQRNISPILDACGWAVNSRAKINIPFGSSLTQIAKLPSGSTRLMTDPYAEKKTPWRLYILLLILIGLILIIWKSGLLF